MLIYSATGLVINGEHVTTGQHFSTITRLQAPLKAAVLYANEQEACFDPRRRDVPSLSRFQDTAQDVSEHRGTDAIESTPLLILVPYSLDRSWQDR
jgi:hypothetical protein